MTEHPLVGRWRRLATELTEYGQESLAALLRRCAAELEADSIQNDLEALTLRQAARESGYSYSALQHGVADGTIPNAGKRGRPKVRRCDVPRKMKRKTESIADQVLRGRDLKGVQ